MPWCSAAPPTALTACSDTALYPNYFGQTCLPELVMFFWGEMPEWLTLLEACTKDPWVKVPAAAKKLNDGR